MFPYVISSSVSGVTMESTPADVPMTNGYSNGMDSTVPGADTSADMSNGTSQQTPDVKKHSSSHHSSSKDKHKHSSSSSKVRKLRNQPMC